MSLQRKDIILIVDDQPANLKVLLSFLQARNFELRILQSGMRALAMLQEITPDIILLDVLMPEMNGFETCKKIKENKSFDGVPVIFMTALDSLEDKVAGFEVGGVDYITKPFQQTEVLVRINTHISLRKKALKLKETQKALLYQKKMLEALLNSIPDPIYFKDRKNRYLGCNRAFEDLAGRQEKDIVGKTDDAVLAEDIADSFRKKDQEMLFSGTSQRTEELVIAPDGQEILLDILRTPYIGPNGDLLGLIGTSRNINALKQAKRHA
ncbi:MAG: hybrid sensor histidine kinase/response regulator, partial [Candidatus Electrothrix sp. AR4]|nr:hybrid sensor histidine kinase/response regulator [Candidatus Electrothrix sp. AR4]